MLYPQPALKSELQDNPKLIEAVWQALNKIPSNTLTGEGRVYGGGLYKIEPNELANAPADDLLTLLPTLSGVVRTQLSFINCIV